MRGDVYVCAFIYGVSVFCGDCIMHEAQYLSHFYVKFEAIVNRFSLLYVLEKQTKMYVFCRLQLFKKKITLAPRHRTQYSNSITSIIITVVLFISQLFSLRKEMNLTGAFRLAF